jgi:hypothetical protein
MKKIFIAIFKTALVLFISLPVVFFISYIWNFSFRRLYVFNEYWTYRELWNDYIDFIKD